METIHLAVSGMTCKGCVASLTRALQSTEGVSAVDVSLEQASATVQIDPARTSTAALRAVVEAAGFEAS
jgi:copper chaperone